MQSTCKSCPAGKHSTAAQNVCADNTCTCPNGTAATGQTCDPNGSEHCTSCDFSFHLKSKKCDKNKCRCKGTACQGQNTTIPCAYNDEEVVQETNFNATSHFRGTVTSFAGQMQSAPPNGTYEVKHPSLRIIVKCKRTHKWVSNAGQLDNPPKCVPCGGVNLATQDNHNEPSCFPPSQCPEGYNYNATKANLTQNPCDIAQEGCNNGVISIL